MHMKIKNKKKKRDNLIEEKIDSTIMEKKSIDWLWNTQG